MANPLATAGATERWASSMTEPRRNTSESGEARPERPTTRADWERLPPDPDPNEDLGYDVLDLEAYETDADHVLFLPADDDMLRDEAFIVVRRDDLRSYVE